MKTFLKPEILMEKLKIVVDEIKMKFFLIIIYIVFYG